MPLSETMMESFNATFARDRDLSEGACEALVYTVWSSLDAAASADWPQTKRLAVDALRWGRIPPAGDTLRGRMTVMGKDPVGAGKGIVFAQHDLLDQAGRRDTPPAQRIDRQPLGLRPVRRGGGVQAGPDGIDQGLAGAFAQVAVAREGGVKALHHSLAERHGAQRDHLADLDVFEMGGQWVFLAACRFGDGPIALAW